MKDKIETIKINLQLLITMIDKRQWSEDINYSSFQKLEKINEKLADVEALINEMEAIMND